MKIHLVKRSAQSESRIHNNCLRSGWIFAGGSIALATLLPLVLAGCTKPHPGSSETGSTETGATGGGECGNGVVEDPEECDNGDDNGNDGLCNADCTEAEHHCGDGIVQSIEECDDANEIDTDECTNMCMTAECGDGSVQDDKEECDDANTVNDDECTNDCVLPFCGDGITQEAAGESCDLGDENSNTGLCTSMCQPPECGDGFVQPGEGCDDGNDDNDDDCSNDCIPSSCGNGDVDEDMNEECDDGNDIDTDDCTNACTTAECGDGATHDGVEECDDGNADNTDSCTTLCAAPTCNDGLMSGDETEVDCGGSCGSCFALSQHTWKGVTMAGGEWTDIEAANYELTTRGGPLEIELSIPLVGGSTSTCRPTVDGEWAGSFEELESEDFWHEGLERTGWNNPYGFRLWSRMRVYYDIPEGDHTLGVQCQTDSGEVTVGREDSSSLILTREYDEVDSKVFQKVSLSSAVVGDQASMVQLPGSEVVANVGGTIEVAISLPIGHGGYAACLPWMGDDPIPSSEQDYENMLWSAGITSTHGSWQLWTHSRIYKNIEPGQHEFSIRCHNSSGNLQIGRDDSASVIIVRELDNENQVVSQGLEPYDDEWDIDGNSVLAVNWYPIEDLDTTIDVTHGTLDVSAFIDYANVNNQVWISCRPTLDGVWAGFASGLTFDSNEEEGVTHQLAGGGWHYDTWYRRRLYTDITPGEHTVGLECSSPGNHYFVGRYGQSTLTVRDVPLINAD